MIKNITVTNYKGESLTLDITNPWETGFIVEKITGLDPGKSTINVSDIVSVDGGRFSSARFSKRTINITLRFYQTDDTSIEALRHKCYMYFPVKKPITITIETDERYAKITGYVQTLDSTIFSKNEGAAITVICPDPFFYNAGPDRVTEFNAVESEFEFPFSNESTSSKLIQMGHLEVKKTQFVEYEGDHEVGIKFYIHSTGNVENAMVINSETGDFIGINTDRLKLITGDIIIKGDEIVICTERGNKSVTLIRNGEEINIINCLMTNSKWLQLDTGSNAFMFDAGRGAQNLQFRLTNKTLYEGI